VIERQPARQAGQRRVRGGVSRAVIYEDKKQFWGDIGRREEDRTVENDRARRENLRRVCAGVQKGHQGKQLRGITPYRGIQEGAKWGNQEEASQGKRTADHYRRVARKSGKFRQKSEAE